MAQTETSKKEGYGNENKDKKEEEKGGKSGKWNEALEKENGCVNFRKMGEKQVHEVWLSGCVIIILVLIILSEWIKGKGKKEKSDKNVKKKK